MKKLFSQLLIFIILVSFTPTEIKAQEFNLYTEDDISVESFPKIPGPEEDVELNLKSYSFNLNNYYIAWFLNGEKQSADYGNKKFNFTTGKTGDVSNVTAVIEFNDQVFRKELRFVPAEVDLLWEATDVYTPPFYRGKAIPLEQAKVKVSAIPETQLIAPSDSPKLIYYWDRNYKRDSSKSGFGKNFFEFELDPLTNTERISVTTNDRRENSFASNKFDLNVTENKAKVLFYEIDENDRVLTHKALNTNPLIKGDTIKLGFFPLHMSSIKENFIDLFIEWNINNESRPPQDFAKQNELFITTSGESGSTPISIELEGVDTILQTASEKINLIFEN